MTGDAPKKITLYTIRGSEALKEMSFWRIDG